MIAIDVLNQIQTKRFQQFHHLQLQIWLISCKLYRLLHHPASVTVLRKRKNVGFYDVKQPLLMLYISTLENFLENIVAKFVFCQLNALLDQRLKNCIFCIGLPFLNDRLHRSRSILVPCPPCCLV